ncbi:hypothetical protein SAMN04487969_1068 [Paenibacillus algorifonticola]|uniref:PQQ-like domain-containing protein n=1 Tax=Paenibacillus algorifonticola TaxID=684063 RepID=A0A1I2CZG9_9BACL|nr:hypothetical protein [Paenibacillus algorifonticola]SFE73678.1 hypothetical protein SAMN04487969_1068 [Paenibacillus algorifonticola]
MKKYALRIQLFSLIAILTTCLSHPVSAADFTELPEPRWTITVPDHTSTTNFDKNDYFLGKKYLPIVSDHNGFRTGYMLQYYQPGGKSKPTYKMMAFDDTTGKQKWIRNSPHAYNAFDMDHNGNLYYVEQVKIEKKNFSKLVALDSNNKQRWVKTLAYNFNWYVLDDGRIATIDTIQNKSHLVLYSAEGKQLLNREYDGVIRHIQGNYVGSVNYIGATTILDIYSISANKKIATAKLPQDYFSYIHADFDVLSGGTLLVPVFDAKTGMETLYGYAPDGKKKWSRIMPTPEPDHKDRLFMSIGNHYLVQDKNMLTVYDTNNKLVATRTFDDLPDQYTLQLLGNQSIAFGGVESKGSWFDFEKPSKAVFYVVDSRTLKTQTSLILEEARFAERNIRFLNANTFYLDMSTSLAKYELK